MALSFEQYPGDGSTVLFSVPFPFISRTHVTVSVDGVATTEFTWLSDSQIQFNTAPASGTLIDIRRNSNLEAPLVDFADGARLKESDLDTANLQAIYLAQESADSAGVRMGISLTGEWDAQNRRIKNVGYPTEWEDAASVAFVRDEIAAAGLPLGEAATMRRAANREAVAALSTVNATSVLVDSEGDRNGLFIWTASDLSAEVAADTQQGIYIAPDSDPSGASGAWVRLTPGDGEWHADWFGIPNDDAYGGGGPAEVQCHAQMTAMVNLGNLVKPSKIVFGSKVYTLGAAIPEFNWQVQLVGSRGAQGTVFVKRYVEASAVRGIFAFNDHGFHCVDLTFRATSGSGGSGISAILTQNSPAAGRSFLVRCYVSVGDFCNHSLYVNGTTNINPAGPSYRGLWIQGGEYFGAAQGSMTFVGVHHVWVTGVFCATTGGSSPIALQISGNATTYNDDFQWHGGIFGNVNINWLGRSCFVVPQQGNITVDANSTDVQWVGPRITGTLTNGAAPGEFQAVYDGMVVASGGNDAAGWRKWGDGRIEQWGSGTTDVSGSVTVTWPMAWPSTPNCCNVNPTSNSGATSIAVCQAHTITGSNFVVKAAGISTGPSMSLISTQFFYHAIGH